jgi:hypothetical protein
MTTESHNVFDVIMARAHYVEGSKRFEEQQAYGNVADLER